MAPTNGKRKRKQSVLAAQAAATLNQLKQIKSKAIKKKKSKPKAPSQLQLHPPNKLNDNPSMNVNEIPGERGNSNPQTIAHHHLSHHPNTFWKDVSNQYFRKIEQSDIDKMKS